MNKFNVLHYYKKAIKNKETKPSSVKTVRIGLVDNYLNPNIKELRDQRTGRCIGLIEKDGDLFKAINYKKEKAVFTSILRAVSFVSGSYRKAVSNTTEISKQLKF